MQNTSHNDHQHDPVYRRKAINVPGLLVRKKDKQHGGEKKRAKTKKSRKKKVQFSSQ